MTTLRQLRYLTAVAAHGHFGRAADACAVTQPALSQQIADLEAELGVKLFERRPSGAALTEIGEEVVGRAQAVLAQVQDLERAAKGGDSLLGPIRLGVIPTIAPFVLPTALPALRAAFPEAEFGIREAISATLLAELRAGSLDLVLLALPVDGEGLECRPLFEDRFSLVTAAAAAPRGPVDPKTLDADSLLLLEDGHCLRAQALAVCGSADPRLREQLGATSLATLVQLVAAGLGATLVPALAIDALVAHDPRLAEIALTEPAPARTIGLAYRGTSSRKAAFARLGEVMTAAVGR